MRDLICFFYNNYEITIILLSDLLNLHNFFIYLIPLFTVLYKSSSFKSVKKVLKYDTIRYGYTLYITTFTVFAIKRRSYILLL